MSKTEKVRQNLAAGYNCAQSIMAAFAEDYGISRELALKLSLNLGGGCAFKGEMCGAVSTAFLIYGLHFGSDMANDELAEEIVYQVSSSHIREFRDIHGKLQCHELLGYNISNPDDFATIMEDDLFKLKCSGFILDSVRILESNIAETEKKLKY